MVLKFITVYVKPGHLDRYLAAQQVWNRETRGAPGYCGCFCGQNPDEPNVVRLQFFWRSRADLERFMSQDHDRIAVLAQAADHYERIEVRICDEVLPESLRSLGPGSSAVDDPGVVGSGALVTEPPLLVPDADWRLIERGPTVEEYRRLRAAVGWWDVEDNATRRGLDKALYSVCAAAEGQIVGCGRVVGDGGLYFYVQDVVVLPEYQKRGIGRAIMDAVMSYLEANARPGAFIGLMAAAGAARFYQRYGFAERPPGRPGMFKVVPIR